MKLNLTIGIVGDSGAMGKWLRAFFEQQGIYVIGSSLDSKLSNRQVVERADVIIFAVSLEAMIPVIQALVPSSRSDQLWMDVGSRKQEIVNEMLRSKAEVVGLHPLCAPPREPNLRNKKLVFYPARLAQWSTWVQYILDQLGAIVKHREPEHHDSVMLQTQNASHVSLLALACVWAQSGHPAEELLALSTASSEKVLGLIKLMLNNSPGVYADIQVGAGEKGLAVIDDLVFRLHEIRHAIAEKDRDAIIDMIIELQKYFG